TISNLREVESREGRIIAVTDLDNLGDLPKYCEAVLTMPFLHEMLSPIILNIPLQLLAYHVAVWNGCDVDLPRNLAKSVTVE
ncbi:MAG: glutamine--fructose-6-phosphate aminotransferase, partial [Proteobacteria bacterium]